MSIFKSTHFPVLASQTTLKKDIFSLPLHLQKVFPFLKFPITKPLCGLFKLRDSGSLCAEAQAGHSWWVDPQNRVSFEARDAEGASLSRSTAQRSW